MNEVLSGMVYQLRMIRQLFMLQGSLILVFLIGLYVERFCFLKKTMNLLESSEENTSVNRNLKD